MNYSSKKIDKENHLIPELAPILYKKKAPYIKYETYTSIMAITTYFDINACPCYIFGKSAYPLIVITFPKYKIY